jgi:hypothetical protein
MSVWQERPQAVGDAAPSGPPSCHRPGGGGRDRGGAGVPAGVHRRHRRGQRRGWRGPFARVGQVSDLAQRAGLAIAERLAAADPTDSQWQRDLSISRDKLGDLARAIEGKVPGPAAARSTLDDRLGAGPRPGREPISTTPSRFLWPCRSRRSLGRNLGDMAEVDAITRAVAAAATSLSTAISIGVRRRRPRNEIEENLALVKKIEKIRLPEEPHARHWVASGPHYCGRRSASGATTQDRCSGSCRGGWSPAWVGGR